MAFAPTNKREVEEHSSRVTDDFGFSSYLLPNSFEDDKAFWGYVSNARAKLATNPLTFPIPRPLNPPATPYTEQPIASTARPLTQRGTESILGELQMFQRLHLKMRMSIISATTLKDENVKNFIDQHKNSNTKRKTESDLRKW